MRASTTMTWRAARLAAILGAAVAVAAVVVAPAFANTANPTSFNATETINGVGGTATVTVTGNWNWPAGQQCVGRYGTAWEIGWWGIGTGAAPTNNFTLTNVSIITANNEGENGVAVATGSDSVPAGPAGSIAFGPGYAAPFTNKNFYVGSYDDGSEIFTQAFCNAAQPPNGNTTAAFNGTYTATATYPNAADVPAELCAVGFDEHGSLNSPTPNDPMSGGLPADFLPTDGDNSIAQNQFVESGQCGSTTVVTLPTSGGLGYLPLLVLLAVPLALLQWRRRRRLSRLAD